MAKTPAKLTLTEAERCALRRFIADGYSALSKKPNADNDVLRVALKLESLLFHCGAAEIVLPDPEIVRAVTGDSFEEILRAMHAFVFAPEGVEERTATGRYGEDTLTLSRKRFALSLDDCRPLRTNDANDVDYFVCVSCVDYALYKSVRVSDLLQQPRVGANEDTAP